MTGECSSESDSDADDDDDYETIFLDCPAITPHPVGHVIFDASKSTSGLVDKPETETASVNGGHVTESATLIGQDDGDRVIVVWGSYNAEREEPEPEVHTELDHVTQSVSLTLPCFEEVLCVISLFFFSFLMFL